jgi:hypothetical protein
MVPISGVFDPAERPRLYFKILEANDEVDDPASASYVEAHYETGIWRFYLPRGHKARTADLRFVMRGMQMGDTMEPQVAIEWVPGHTALRRAATP